MFCQFLHSLSYFFIVSCIDLDR
uniref:Cyclic nucleotide-gated ion channel 1-like n=1 Tax=Rhizophora mucronata TaxID=61149 RepID=A0A2P2LDD6_RHIMU